MIISHFTFLRIQILSSIIIFFANEDAVEMT